MTLCCDWSVGFLSFQFFAELVFRLVREKFTELATGHNKALAGIVMTIGEFEFTCTHKI